jgi:predicted MFS family arabinose efflux permease
MALVPLLVYLAERYGFGTTTLVAAILLWVSVLPLAVFVVKRRPQDVGLLPDGVQDSVQGSVAVDAGSSPGENRQWTRAGALRTLAFWMIAIPFALGFVAQVGFLVHQLSFLQPSLGPTWAAFAVSATTLVALIGRLVLGLFLDYVDRRFLSAGCVTIQGLALVLMASVPAPGILLLGSMIFGLGVGILITLPPLLTQEDFGTASFGTVFAMVNGAMQVGVALGPSIVGVLRDHWGGYEGTLYVLAAIDALAMALIFCGRELRGAGVQGPESTAAKSVSSA